MQINPTTTMATPNINNHQDKGSNNANSIPIPKPIKHIDTVFFKSLKHILNYLPCFIILIFYVKSD